MSNLSPKAKDKISVQFDRVTINTANMPDMLEFYRAIGLDLQMKKISLGSQIYSTKVGNVEFQLYGINVKDPSATPPMQLSFEVDDLDLVFSQISLLSGVDVIMEPTELADGKRTIILDPDGQSVEITQPSKL